ncbi:hypothetical protein LR48_Vigan02g143800 [Vigna angularis]|uniref:Protein SLOW GREEN 1 n=2 Tax=Phaseolus angularis TaxID=3914 RepID=A0A0L9TXH3_PHAAN|nr:protein SLOW GREEN 1, chloroplastic [Vigna angularis]XP_017413445.1 protein SLOW GREEN 1, chloroplastic [Vigna angularis]XP_052731357.1 protein SLOW GREEN 1, chloroplastic [Vigna angularis]XP_052731358.1 protein SLOW GREEN 1, chloroplastic [Vigna angularis]BAT95414.1 hypothetical protein VIGAN_08212900 [Vigna angularis var. angularis]KAG2402648.1 protein SLOW GREEN 1 [Vigna angularis]KOM35288.1 hypothetical protein LR48_Vigan02g143800 [Vigna angularis]
MESLPGIQHYHLSLSHSSPLRSLKLLHASSFPTPIRASSSPSPKQNVSYKPQTQLTQLLKTLNPLLSPLVKPTCIAIATTAFSFMRLHPPPVASALTHAPPPPSSASEILSDDTASSEILSDETAALETLPDDTAASDILPDDTSTSDILPDDKAASETLPDEVAPAETLSDESVAQEQSSDDVVELESLLRTKMRASEIDEALLVLDRLIELEPEELEYPFVKAHLHLLNGEHELASMGFEELLQRDPFHLETYRCLLMLISETKAPTVELLKKIEEAVKVCAEQERDSDVRDFKLLIAQIKVIDGDLYDALKVYEELEKEEPKDFRPYLGQGIVYTMLKKNDEAEKQFEMFGTLAPENHPYKQYFEDTSRILETGLQDTNS